MRVKKYEAESVIDALSAIKKDLGPEAIILSTKEESRGMGLPPVHIVVAAATDEQLKKKKVTEEKLGEKYQDQFFKKSAHQQKSIINNVYQKLEGKFELKNRKITSTPYIEIADEKKVPEVVPPEAVEASLDTSTGKNRVKQAAQAAFSASLGSEFFSKKLSLRKSTTPLTKTVSKPEALWPAETSAMMLKLQSAGVNQKLIEKLLSGAIKNLQPKGKLTKVLIEAWCAKWILGHTKTIGGQLPQGVELFVGPSGSGKTSALIKVATDYVMNHRRKVAILTTDVKKVGGIEQHKVYSRILNIHFEVVDDIKDWKSKIQELENYDNILVDTPGTSMYHSDDLEFLRELSATKHGRETHSHLVLSAMTKSDDLAMLVRKFSITNFKDVIFSNIDQTSQHGLLINFQEKFNIPFHSFGMSSDVIDGFEWATRERVLDLVFKLTRINGDKSYGSVL